MGLGSVVLGYFGLAFLLAQGPVERDECRKVR